MFSSNNFNQLLGKNKESSLSVELCLSYMFIIQMNILDLGHLFFDVYSQGTAKHINNQDSLGM